jgi:ABC-type Mn2+/Zn2+ transport system ATPase subunit
MQNRIIIKNLTVHYDNLLALEVPFLDIELDGVVGVIGPNGAGKSSFFKAILDLVAYEGDISINGTSIAEQRKRIAYIPQRNDVDWTFPATVYDVVEMGRFTHKRVWEKLNGDDKKIVVQAMQDAGIDALQNRQIGELSGGQQQKTFIARALAQSADILLLDEPFVGVDAVSERQIIDLLKNLTQQGKLILVIHHDLAKAKAYFDEVIMIKRSIIAAGEMPTTFTEENIKLTFGY